MLGLLIVAFALQISLQPYASPLVNSLETAALGVLMLTFWVRNGLPLVCSFAQCTMRTITRRILFPGRQLDSASSLFAHLVRVAQCL